MHEHPDSEAQLAEEEERAGRAGELTSIGGPVNEVNDTRSPAHASRHSQIFSIEFEIEISCRSAASWPNELLALENLSVV